MLATGTVILLVLIHSKQLMDIIKHAEQIHVVLQLMISDKYRQAFIKHVYDTIVEVTTSLPKPSLLDPKHNYLSYHR